MTIMIVTTFGLTRLTLHTTDACHDGRIECAAASVDPHGTAMSNTINAIGGAIGTALFVPIMSVRSERHIAAIIREQQINPADQAQMALATNQGMPS
ncbi:hypothetical protein M3558_08405 [Brevibacillus invocatus]|nr:hypothetical protein [Brevibacillus invocatus]